MSGLASMPRTRRASARQSCPGSPLSGKTASKFSSAARAAAGSGLSAKTARSRGQASLSSM